MTEDSFAYPDWLDQYAVAEALMAEAYESLDLASRSAFKKSIARLHAIWGERPELERQFFCARQGFCLERENRPADVAVIVCSAGYRYPAAFLAVLMPAILAGTRSLVPVFTPVGPEEGSAFSGNVRVVRPQALLLAALELAGVEQAFVLEEADILRLLQGLRPETTRLVLLGETAFGESLLLHAHAGGMGCRTFMRPPWYYSERLGLTVLSGFEPEVPLAEGEEPPCAGAALRLDAAHEDVWLWPDLAPDWFRLCSARLFAP